MRKTWRLQGFSETCIIAPRSLVSQEEQGAYLSAQLDRWLTDPLTQKSVLEIYESLRGQSALLARRLRGTGVAPVCQVRDPGSLPARRTRADAHAACEHPSYPRTQRGKGGCRRATANSGAPPKGENVGWDRAGGSGRYPVPQARYVLELPDGTKKIRKAG